MPATLVGSSTVVTPATTLFRPIGVRDGDMLIFVTDLIFTDGVELDGQPITLYETRVASAEPASYTVNWGISAEASIHLIVLRGAGKERRLISNGESNTPLLSPQSHESSRALIVVYIGWHESDPTSFEIPAGFQEVERTSASSGVLMSTAVLFDPPDPTDEYTYVVDLPGQSFFHLVFGVFHGPPISVAKRWTGVEWQQASSRVRTGGLWKSGGISSRSGNEWE